MDGVIRTRVGYAGGNTPFPTYRNLGDHTESIEVQFDPKVVSFGDLLDVFSVCHRPDLRTSRQYRSVIFHRDERQKLTAGEKLGGIELSYNGRIFTSIEPLKDFHIAEDYHQKYYLRRVSLLAGEYRNIYRDEGSFRDSTAAARLNGFIGGHGGMDLLETLMPELGLSAAGSRLLRDIVIRHDECFSG